jgi:L-asparaginase/beta-aspartyl-peptidase (threonine type)
MATTDPPTEIRAMPPSMEPWGRWRWTPKARWRRRPRPAAPSARRVGDTPLIGAGTWADDLVAVSCTGVGEFFIRGATAYDLSARMRYGGADLGQAAQGALDQVGTLGGDGGLIAIDRQGRIVMPYNSQGMKRAAAGDGTAPYVRVFEPGEV